MNAPKIIAFLFCLIIPINSICMMGNTRKSLQPKKKPLQALIQNLKTNKPISITEFLHYLDDAKKQNLKIYLIAQTCINTLDLEDKKNIETLFQKSISTTNAFKNEKDTIFFQAHEIPAGFICLINSNLYKKEKNIPVILTKLARPKTIDDKLARLGIFNIRQTINDEKIEPIDTFLFPLATNTELEALYDTVMAESERIQKVAQETSVKTESIPPIIPQSTEEITTEPVIEIVKTEEEKAKEQEKEQKQTALAQKYKPTLELIQTIGQIPRESKNKASQLIINLEKGSLDEPEVIKAQTFFKDLENTAKKIKEEAAEIAATPPKTFPFIDLITRVQNNEIVTISDFLSYLDDAKNQNLVPYFISTNLLNSSPLKDKVLNLFETNISNPDIFTTDSISFQVYKIKTGFICSINSSSSPSYAPTILTVLTTKPDLQAKLTILSTFNIQKNVTDKKIDEIDNREKLLFPLAANSILGELYDTITAIEKIKDFIQEQKKEIKKESGIKKLDIYKIIIPPLTPQKKQKRKQNLGGPSSGE